MTNKENSLPSLNESEGNEGCCKEGGWTHALCYFGLAWLQGLCVQHLHLPSLGPCPVAPFQLRHCCCSSGGQAFGGGSIPARRVLPLAKQHLLNIPIPPQGWEKGIWQWPSRASTGRGQGQAGRAESPGAEGCRGKRLLLSAPEQSSKAASDMHLDEIKSSV